MKPVPVFVAALALLLVPVLGLAAVPSLSDTVIHARSGQEVSLSAYRGRWVLINYWATWCGDCVSEIPTLNRIASDAHVAVVGLSDEKIQPPAWAAFLAAHPLSYPVALVDRQTLPRQIPPTAFMIEMRPISYLIGPDGDVARRFIGAVSPAEIDAAITHRKG